MVTSAQYQTYRHYIQWRELVYSMYTFTCDYLKSINSIKSQTNKILTCERKPKERNVFQFNFPIYNLHSNDPLDTKYIFFYSFKLCLSFDIKFVIQITFFTIFGHLINNLSTRTVFFHSLLIHSKFNFCKYSAILLFTYIFQFVLFLRKNCHTNICILISVKRHKRNINIKYTQ